LDEDPLRNTKNQKARGLVFLVLLGIGAALFSRTILSLLTVSSNRELYSHIPLIPFVTLYFFFVGWKTIFSEVKWDYARGLLLMAGALAVCWLGRHLEGRISEHNDLSLMMSGFFVWILGTFLFSYGDSAARKGAFPLLFLVFMIPIPTPILDPLVRFLQHGSAEFSQAILKVTGVPFHRDGLVFFLPGLTIEVAEQCSGIRSSIALFITGILAGKLFLSKGWARLVLLLSVFPVSMFKNAVRIVTLALLGAYVDPRFITGSWLHKSGGILFFVLGLLLLLPVLLGIRKWEERRFVVHSKGRVSLILCCSLLLSCLPAHQIKKQWVREGTRATD
jgi:exosortase